jgi:hypothetical protein
MHDLKKEVRHTSKREGSLFMKKALALAACLIFAAMLVGIAATSASAFPSNTGACDGGCHNMGGVAPVVTPGANDGTTATFTVSAPGAVGWAVFQGSPATKRLGGSEGSDAYAGATATGGTFQVPDGATYTIFAGSGDPMAPVISATTVSPTGGASSFTVTPTADAHGAISPSAPQTVAKGDNVTFTFTPDTGYVVADVLVNGVSKGASPSYTISNVTATTTIEVKFAQAAASYTITASAGANGAVTPTGAQTVASGADKTFTITPAAGYYPKVTIDGQAVTLFKVGGVYSYTFTNVTTNHEIAATFAASPTACTITATVGAHGAIIPNSPDPYNLYPGSSITYAFVPDAGYHVDQVLVNGTPVTLTDGEFTFWAVDQNYTLDASFAQNTYTITATVDAHGTITPAGATKVAEGDASPAYAIAAASGYHVTNVTVDGVPVGIKTTYTFQDVTVDHTIAVTTAADAVAFAITPTAGAHGAIIPAGSFEVVTGGTLTVFFVPDAGYTVGTVTVDGQVQPPVDVTKDDFSYTFANVTANHTVAVTFVVAPPSSYTITATAGSGGTITPSGAASVTTGANQTFTVAPNTGYAVASVLVDGVAATLTNNAYTFTNVQAAHTIAVTFSAVAPKTYAITATAGAGGTITPSGAASVTAGANQTFTVTPAAGYQVASVLVDGVAATLTNNAYTFTNVQATHTIAVTFAASVQKCSLTLSLSGLKSGALKLGKSVTAKGAMKPAWAATVKITVQRKVSGAWKTVATKSRTANATSGAYSWSYKPTKKGSYRMQTSSAKSAHYTAAVSTWKTCTVK